MLISTDTIVAIDISGTIPLRKVEKLFDHIENMLYMIGCHEEALNIKVCWVGYKILGVSTIKDGIDAMPKCGMGGNNIECLFDEVNRLKMPPSSVIYLTDGYGCIPADKPDYSVYWLHPTSQHASMPWGISGVW